MVHINEWEASIHFNRHVWHSSVAKIAFHPCCLKSDRVLFLLVRCVLTVVKRFMLGEPFFFLASLKIICWFSLFLLFQLQFLFFLFLIFILGFFVKFLFGFNLAFQFQFVIYYYFFFIFFIFFLDLFVKVLLVLNFIIQFKFMLYYYFQFSPHSFDFFLLKLFFFSI